MSKRLAVLIPSVAAAAVGLFIFLPSLRPADSTNQTDWPTVRPVKGTLSNSATAIGTVKPSVGGQVKVGSQISGVLDHLNVNVGDVVKKGDVLAVLNTRELRARADVLAADLSAARAQYEYAVKELARSEKVPDIARNKVDDNRRNAEVRRAEIQRTEAQLKQAEIQLDYARITAPMSGTIESVSTYEGETVAASFSAPTFVTIVDLGRLEVECYVDETDVGKIRVGQPVEFSVEAFPDEMQKGTVRTILPKAKLINSVVNYVVIVEIADKSRLALRPEMTARVNFSLEDRQDTINVPRSALLRDGSGSFLVVRTQSGWARKPVRIGLVTAPRVEIVSGLSPADEVLADGQLWAQRQGK